MIRAMNAKRTNNYKNAIHELNANDLLLSLSCEQIVEMTVNNQANKSIERIDCQRPFMYL